jgi:hypothetical protein
MGMAMIDKTASIGSVAKTLPLRNLARHLVREWQRIVDDRRQLWHAYGNSPVARNLPRCVWRRHGALLMYAKHRAQ